MTDGSLTRTAAGLAITQPASSHALKRLVGAVGESLFWLVMADVTAALLARPLLSELQADQARVAVRVLPLTTHDPRRLLLDGEADLLTVLPARFLPASAGCASACNARLRAKPDQASTAAIALAVRSTLPVLSPATHMRPERIR